MATVIGSRSDNVSPGLQTALDPHVAERLGGGRRVLSVDLDSRAAAPAWNPQVQGKTNRFGRRQLQLDGVVEGIIRGLGERDRDAVAHLGGDRRGGVERGAQPAVGGGQPQFLGVIRPAVGDVVLAAAITFKGAVGEHVAAVFEAGRLVVAVQLHHVGAGKIVQPLQVRRHRGGEGIEGDLLAAVGPERDCRKSS